MARLRQYQKSIKHTLATTRFDDATWQENNRFRETIREKGVRCMYASPIAISAKVAADSYVFVLEMNNQQNKIMGIGMVKNHAMLHKIVPYGNMNYNRYVYTGRWRIDAADMTPEEREILRLFECMCFKGANHLKRGQGITAFPVKLLYLCSGTIDLPEYVRMMFKTRIDASV